MTKIGKGIFVHFLTFGFLCFASAQEGIVVQADIDRDRVEVGENVTVTVTVQSSENVEVEAPHLPSLTGLELLQQWNNTSVQQSLTQTNSGMDWKTVRKQQFHFLFRTMATGRFSLDPFEVIVNGKLFQTRPILVEVLPQGSGQGAPPPSGGSGIPGLDEDEERILREQEEIFNQLLRPGMRKIPGLPSGRPGTPGASGGRAGEGPEPEFRSMPTNPNDAFFIQLEVDKTSVYEGEQITASWYLLTRGQMESLDRVKFPALKGFWKEIIEENPQIQFYEEIINGVVYRKALLASHALFPIKSGKTFIDEFTAKSRIRLATQGYGFGYGRAYEFTKSSKRLEIEVKPLPNQGRPPQFTGAVGLFDVNAEILPQPQYQVNQPFTLRIRFEGKGNAKSIDLPAIEWPAGLELYDTKNESRFFKDGRSFKEFEVLLIPRQQGPLEIPSVNFAFFNPQTQKYELKKTEPLRLEIQAAPVGEAIPSGSFLGGEKVTAKVLSMPALMTTVSKGTLGSPFSVWGGLFIFEIVGLLGWSVYQLRNRSGSLSLRKRLEGQWKKVEKAKGVPDPRQVGVEIVNCFNLVLSELASHRGDVLEISKMIELLSPDLRSQYGASIFDLYEKAQVLSFAPDGVVSQMGKSESFHDLLKKSRELLFELSKT